MKSLTYIYLMKTIVTVSLISSRGINTGFVTFLRFQKRSDDIIEGFSTKNKPYIFLKEISACLQVLETPVEVWTKGIAK